MSEQHSHHFEQRFERSVPSCTVKVWECPCGAWNIRHFGCHNQGHDQDTLATIAALERELGEARAENERLKRVAVNQKPWLAGLGRFLFEYKIVFFPGDVLAWRDERDEAQAQLRASEEAREGLREALAECQRLAIERVKTADAAVKKDVYAADALMGIATIARRALSSPSTGLYEALNEGIKNGRTAMEVKVLLEGHTVSCQWYPALDKWTCHPTCAAIKDYEGGRA